MLDLWVAAWRAAMPDMDFDARRPWCADHLDGLAAAGVSLVVAETAGTVVGFVTVDGRRGHVDQLAVHPDAQGRGIADRLIAHAKLIAPGGLALDVNAANGRARRFYARHGFRTVGTGVNARSGLPTLSLCWTPGQDGRPDPDIH